MSKNIDFRGSGLFKQAVAEMLEEFPKRSQNILKQRFGVDSGKSETLSEIGLNNGITRERVRQIVQNILKQIKSDDKLKKKGTVYEACRALEFTLSQNSGIIRKKNLLNSLLDPSETDQQGNVELLLACHADIVPLKSYKVENDTLIHREFNFLFWEKVEGFVVEFLKKHQKVVCQERITEIGQNHPDLSTKKLIHFLNVSRRIKQNVFGDWGLHHWDEITPKNIGQKAYLVLKKHQKPCHFKEIASLIDKYGLGKKTKKSHPQTVHNELIKDKRFILVGRGTYALAEWGYKHGTVKEVIEDILKKSNQPLSREEIIEKVLQYKQVKPATVNINLSNYFNPVNNNQYFILKKNTKVKKSIK